MDNGELKMENFKAWRYQYRSIKHSTEMGPWHLLNSTCPYDTEAGALQLVERWNKKDRGQYCWRVEECLPTDFDYPK